MSTYYASLRMLHNGNPVQNFAFEAKSIKAAIRIMKKKFGFANHTCGRCGSYSSGNVSLYPRREHVAMYLREEVSPQPTPP